MWQMYYEIGLGIFGSSSFIVDGEWLSNISEYENMSEE